MESVSEWGRASVVGQDKGNGSLRPADRYFLRPLPASSEGHSGSHEVIVTRTASPESSLRRIANAALLTLTALAAFAGLGSLMNLRITLTDSSAPAGVYRLVANAPVKRGTLVAACLPQTIAQDGLTRGYLRPGDCPAGAEPVAKIIGALPGEAVTVEPGGVVVNGVTFADSRTAARDSAGRPLAHVPFGLRPVSSGEAWLFGFNDPRSWDSRYFGPVPITAIRGSLKPILTW